MQKLIDYLEELLISMGILSFSVAGFTVSLTAGLMLTSIGLLFGAYMVIKFKEMDH
ncbi:hypothetical protein GMB70_13365 [Turicibacter sanguinis]|nr:hypothetical protein [Turicibacter sanguinis]